MRIVLLPRLKYVAVDPWIVEKVRGKSVLHLGCVGDYAYDNEARWQDACLHLRLAEVVPLLHGLDLNHAGIERLARILPPDDGRIEYLVGDVEETAALVGGRTYDCVVAGSIIEHLSNPGKMLESVGPALAVGGKLILVTPHSFGLPAFLRVAVKRNEAVNPEHTCWFSIATLTELLRRYGFEAIEWCTGYGYHHASRSWDISKKIGIPFLRLFPHLGGSLMCVAKSFRRNTTTG